MEKTKSLLNGIDLPKRVEMKIYCFALCLFVTSYTFAQTDTTKKEFYPLNIGNVWQYRDESNAVSTEKIIGDTVVDGIQYFLLIHSLQTSGGLMRIDSLFRVINRRGGPYWGDSCGGNNLYELSIYHLGEEDSTSWKICDGLYLEQFVRYNGISVMNIFGQAREVMDFDYGGIAEGGDTLWFYGARLAKGIGMIEEQHYEWSYMILQGAIIDGVQYGTIVSVDEMPVTIPENTILYPNYPNPFNPTTKIRYSVPNTSLIFIKIYDVLGNEVATLVNEHKPAGTYEVNWDAGNFPSGVYFYKLQTENYIAVKKMLLMK